MNRGGTVYHGSSKHDDEVLNSSDFELTSSSTVRQSDNADESSTVSLTPVVQKTYTVGKFGGVINVNISGFRGNALNAVNIRIYKNGSAEGTLRNPTSEATPGNAYAEDITVAAGDVLTLCAWTSNAATGVNTNTWELRYDHKIVGGAL